MKSKLIETLVALTLILGSGGYAQAMGSHDGTTGGAGTAMGPGSMTHDTGSMSGPQGGMGQQGMNPDSDTPSAQSQGEIGHGHGAPNTEGKTNNPQSNQGHGGLMGGPPYCP